MEDPNKEVVALKAQVAQLQDKIAELRHSRRILMDLLGCQDRLQRIALQQLMLENRRLRRRQGNVARCPTGNRPG